MSTAEGLPSSSLGPDADPSITTGVQGEGAVSTPPPTGPIVVDASFIIAVLEGHPDASRLAASGVLGRSVLLSVTYAEVLRVMYRRARMDPSVLTEGLRALGVRLLDYPGSAAQLLPVLADLDVAVDQQAQRHGRRRAQLSLGDLCVLSYAMHARVPVVTGDRHWAALAAGGLKVDVHLYQSSTYADHNV